MIISTKKVGIFRLIFNVENFLIYISNIWMYHLFMSEWIWKIMEIYFGWIILWRMKNVINGWILPLSTFVMLMPRPGFLNWRHQPFDVRYLKKPLGDGSVESTIPRSISEERHEDESSRLEERRFRSKHPQFPSIFITFQFTM